LTEERKCRIMESRYRCADLSMLMQIITKDERYRPNVLKKAIMRHIASPASQDTVIAHPISNGIIRNVT